LGLQRQRPVGHWQPQRRQRLEHLQHQAGLHHPAHLPQYHPQK